MILVSIHLFFSANNEMSGFGFVEFENAKVSPSAEVCLASLSLLQDAEDAVYHFNGKTFMGAK